MLELSKGAFSTETSLGNGEKVAILFEIMAKNGDFTPFLVSIIIWKIYIQLGNGEKGAISFEIMAKSGDFEPFMVALKVAILGLKFGDFEF